jgi:putative N6-adenine-specific DNA methylase
MCGCTASSACDDCTLYLDTSGAPLYQRGFRQKTVEAPLKENLAAGILRLSGWQPGVALLDPMCGSGTFLIEAAQMALDIAPGARRDFAFQRLRHFDPGAWKRLLDAARAQEKPAAARREFSAAISRRLPCARRWPTSTAPDCCRRSP